MRSSALPLAVALAALAGPAAAAVDVAGELGLVYGRTEAWAPATHSLVPRLQLDGFVQASGPVGGYDIGSWRGRVGYDRLRTTFEDSTRQSDQILTYSAMLRLGDPTAAPVSLTASADRIATDSSSASSDARITGTRVDTIYATRVDLGQTELPKVSVGGSIRDSVADGFATARSTESTKLLDASVQHGPGVYDLKLGYQGRWNSGSLDLLDYTSHTLDLNGSTHVADGVDGFLTGRWYLRTPDTLGAANPRYEETHLVSGVRTVGDGDRFRVQYGYDHLFFTAALTGERERVRHTVSVWRELVHSTSWESVWTVDLTGDQERAGGLEDSAYGAVATPLARWRHRSDEREVQLEAGPSIGVLKPTGGDPLLASGARWRGRVSWNGTVRYGLDYTGDWGRNLQGTLGWGLNQAVTGDAETPVGTGRGRAALTVSANRQHTDLFGDTASRNVVLFGSLAWRSTQVQLDAGLRDGTSPAVAGVQGDGLFIPAAFDSHSQYAALSGTVWLTRELSAIGRVRYARLSGPDVPSQQEASMFGALAYRIGQLQLSLEERYSAGGPSSFDNRINEVWIRVSRSFDARY